MASTNHTTSVIPVTDRWWPLTGMTRLLVTHTDGHCYVVPSTFDVVPRDYDCALALPAARQQRICQGDEAAWPKEIDPKCVVVLMGRVLEGTSVPFWFTRLSLTPHVLRRVPLGCRNSIRDSLELDETFRTSTLVTHYIDSGSVFDASIQTWELYNNQRASWTSPGLPQDQNTRIISPRDLEISTKDRGLPDETTFCLACVICQDNPPQYVALPCGHLSFCRQCAQVTNFETCPLCRSPISYTTRIFGM